MRADIRTGANGNIGVEIVVRSPPDGYTMVLMDIGNLTISPSMYLKLPFDIIRDLVPVTTGDGDFLFMGVIQTWVHVKSGKLKLIAVSSEQRDPMFPQVPTVAETPGLEGYNAGSWQGILGPARMPPEVANKTYNEVKRIIALPEINERLTSQGSRPQAKTPQEMGVWLATEKDRWAKVVKESGFKVE